MLPISFEPLVSSRGVAGAAACVFFLLAAGSGLAATNIAGPSGTCVSSCSILQSAGTLSGANLFHSFTKFSIGSGDTVTFTALPATTINNVFSRVTGGARSLIEGTLSLEAGAGSRNFFLINPAGITFSGGAMIDVPGAFHATTADYVKFPDGNFHADPSRASTFSSAAPAAFGFFGTNRSTVELAGTVLTTAGPIDLVAGDITINGGGISNSTGDVRLVAAGNQVTEIPVSLKDQIPAVNGNLDIYNATVATETSTGSAGGNITLAAGKIVIDYSWVQTVTSGSGRAGDMSITAGSLDVTNLSDVGSLTVAGSSGDAGNVTIVASGDVLIDNSYLRADTDGAGKGGTLTLTAAHLSVDHESFISSDSLENATGAGGSLIMDVAGLTRVANDSWISADARGAGNGGLVSLVTGSLLIDGGVGRAGISSDALKGSSGSGGLVSVIVMGDGEVVSGGRISTLTEGTGNAGLVYVNAKNLTIDGQGEIPDDYPTGIFSTADTHSTGDAGSIVVAVDGSLRLAAAGRIATTAKGSGYGNAGAIQIAAGSLMIDGAGSEYDTGVMSRADSALGGNSGVIELDVKKGMVLQNGGVISTSTWAGDAGLISIKAASITLDGESGIYSNANDSSISYGDAGSIDITATGQIAIRGGSFISSDTESVGKAGWVSVKAGSLFVDGGAGKSGISSDALEGSSGNGGLVSVVLTGDGELVSGGRISTLTEGTGNAGSVYVSAKNLKIDGKGSIPDDFPTGIFSTADKKSTGDAGSIGAEVNGTVHLAAAGRIATTAKGSGYGNAGAIQIAAGRLVIDGAGPDSIEGTGVMSRAKSALGGYSGVIELDVKNGLHLKNGGVISTSTWAGDAGLISIKAASIALDGESGIYSNANDSLVSYGNAGNIDITATGHVAIRGGSFISSDTETVGNAGSVSVKAGSMTLDGQGEGSTGISSDAMSSASSYGNGGNVNVIVSGRLSLLNGASISSDTYDVGNAGAVTVNAGSLIIDRQGGALTGIYSDSNRSSYIAGSGNAGNVDVAVAGQLSVLSGGRISSRTDDFGKAGTVRVNAGNLLVSGISDTNGVASSIDASASADSSGQTGSVVITVANATQLKKGAEISIRNKATVADPSVLVPTTLTITSPDLSLNSSAITAASTGNVAASNIVVNSSGTLYLDPSQITTSSNLGNGGSIFINGGHLVWLDRSQITTSVFGLTGNGGDINITADNLVLSSGFIQANTAAAHASGGNILLSTRSLMPSGGMLSVGGSTPHLFNPNTFGNNVIQAAAPDGVSGSISITSPTIDLSGSLAGINARVLDSGGLGRNPCQSSHGNSLSVVGRGGLPLPAGGPLHIEAPVSFPVPTGRAPGCTY